MYSIGMSWLVQYEGHYNPSKLQISFSLDPRYSFKQTYLKFTIRNPLTYRNAVLVTNLLHIYIYIRADNHTHKRNFHFPGRSRICEEGQSRLAMWRYTHPQEIRVNRCTLFGQSTVSMRTVQQNSVTKTYIQPERI
jgi:hypothetical protein